MMAWRELLTASLVYLNYTRERTMENHLKQMASGVLHRSRKEHG